MTVPHTRGSYPPRWRALEKHNIAEDRFGSFHFISFASLVTNKGFMAIPRRRYQLREQIGSLMLDVLSS